MVGAFELTGIEFVESSESRALVEHRVPGLAGNYLQDLGSVPNRIVIGGTRHGDEARDAFLTGIRELFNAGTPATFVADINTATDVTDVVVEDLQVSEVVDGVLRYTVTLRKYVPPPEPPQTGLLDTGILGDALGLCDALDALDALASLVELADIPDLSDPTRPLTGALDGVRTALGGLEGATSAAVSLFAG